MTGPTYNSEAQKPWKLESDKSKALKGFSSASTFPLTVVVLIGCVVVLVLRRSSTSSKDFESPMIVVPKRVKEEEVDDGKKGYVLVLRRSSTSAKDFESPMIVVPKRVKEEEVDDGKKRLQFSLGPKLEQLKVSLR
ncbi:hypothetical protein L6452_13439 [Arctium lappa]|uniref:Uncharacterized protein n=1 Tax=Arctium lappa TaxID=4217 RepID=A0ACB9CIB7_ARCLA|nr:hypothetical protein L6452_13439 [Arctium lappa]